MQIFTRHETDAYILRQDCFGCFNLTRKADKASALFQGDDADLWECNMASIESIKQWSAAYPRGIDDAFDFLCSSYDEVLTIEGTCFGQNNV